MEYSIFVRASDRPASEVLAQLEAIRSTACSLTTRLLEGYIWQQDGFALEIVHHDGNVKPHSGVDLLTKGQTHHTSTAKLHSATRSKTNGS